METPNFDMKQLQHEATHKNIKIIRRLNANGELINLKFFRGFISARTFIKSCITYKQAKEVLRTL